MLLDEKYDPWPKLYLEYAPGGTRSDQNISWEPLNSLYVGPSLQVLERELPMSLGQSLGSSLPRSVPDSDPHLVAGGAGYVQDEHVINTVEGRDGGDRPWGVGGRS